MHVCVWNVIVEVCDAKVACERENRVTCQIINNEYLFWGTDFEFSFHSTFIIGRTILLLVWLCALANC